MNFVLCYINKKLPEYIYISLKQLRYFNPNIPIYFITNADNINCDKSITIINIEKLKKLSKHINFQKYNCMKTVITPNVDKQFWTLSTERFFYIEELMKQYNLQNIIQIECDNLIYYNFEKLYSRINVDHMLCSDREKTLSNAITYFSDLNSIASYTEFLNNMASKGFYHIWNLFNKYKIKDANTKTATNDMTLSLLYYRMYKDTKSIDLWPNLPFDKPLFTKESNRNFNKFNVLFDGAQWGMYLGGWPQNVVKDNPTYGPGFTHSSWYIGKMLLSKDIDLIWGKDDKNRKVPYCINLKTKEKIPIVNLHIHCKKLEKFISY